MSQYLFFLACRPLVPCRRSRDFFSQFLVTPQTHYEERRVNFRIECAAASMQIQYGYTREACYCFTYEAIFPMQA